MDFAIHTEQLSRTYKIRGGKKSEPRSLVASAMLTWKSVLASCSACSVRMAPVKPP